jgi:hypothetical protein
MKTMLLTTITTLGLVTECGTAGDDERRAATSATNDGTLEQLSNLEGDVAVAVIR